MLTRSKARNSKTGTRGQVSTPTFLVAPVEGLYVGAPLAEAPPKTAFILDNAFPNLDFVRVRGGTQTWASGLSGGVVDSILTWTDGSTHRMFGCVNGSIYDASSPGPVGASVVSGLTPAKVESVQFTGTGGQFLIAVNGYDPAQLFDGTSWNPTISFTATVSAGLPTLSAVSSFTGLVNGQALSGPGIPDGATISSMNVGAGTITMSANASAGFTTAAITASILPPISGLTGNQLAQIWVYKNRIYGVERGSLNAWYLGLDSIGGQATKFPLTSVFTRGGYLLCGGTWALPTINGLFEACVFVSSEGEVAVYTGLYPGSTDWAKQGIYKISKPLGRRCLLNTGGDLLILTEDGIVPMSKVETLDQQALQNVALTQKIMPAWIKAVNQRTGLDGWQAIIWPLNSMAIVNLPHSGPEDKTQFVANSRTGAWGRYLGWDANCFALFDNQLFYGSSDGRIMQAEVGATDDGRPYTATIFPSFTHLESFGVRKQIKLIKTQLQANFYGAVQVTTRVDYDPSIPAPPSATISTAVGVARWGFARWGIDVWPALLFDLSFWTSPAGLGEVISPVLQITLDYAGLQPDFRLTGFQVIYETGSAIG
ncbi:MAG: hypothetical protein WC683_17310 [bacterium]